VSKFLNELPSKTKTMASNPTVRIDVQLNALRTCMQTALILAADNRRDAREITDAGLKALVLKRADSFDAAVAQLQSAINAMQVIA